MQQLMAFLANRCFKKKRFIALKKVKFSNSVCCRIRGSYNSFPIFPQFSFTPSKKNNSPLNLRIRRKIRGSTVAQFSCFHIISRLSFSSTLVLYCDASEIHFRFGSFCHSLLNGILNAKLIK